ncbi:MAG: hypothetical protein DRN29_06530 [Thermoplasmata archaeon]|nr:MAG: hypothetical protein DRN29_06530 [Thermoplasmata archaeon]
MGKNRGVERIASIFAIFLLLIGTVSTIYVYSFREEKQAGNAIIINGVEYDMNEIFSSFEKKYINEFSGILLSDLINETSIQSPENHEYAIIGADGYTKTVKWGDMKEGILTNERRVIFQNLPRQFWIRDVVKIEVK